MTLPITLRRVRPSDEGSLYQVFVSTRPDIAALDAPHDEKSELYRAQFNAQSFHYQTHFGDADFLIVSCANEPVGRLTVHRGVDEIRVIDIAILPAHRGKGIGTQLMSDILKEGRIADKPVRIHVEKYSRALRFYEQLGFVKIAEKEYHWFMEYRPSREVVAPTGS